MWWLAILISATLAPNHSVSCLLFLKMLLYMIFTQHIMCFYI